MADSHSRDSHSPLRRFIDLLLLEGRDIRAIAFFAVLSGLFNLAVPLSVMGVINSVALSTVVQQLIVLCVGLFISLALAGILRGMKQYTVELIQRRIMIRTMDEVSQKLLHLSPEYPGHLPDKLNTFLETASAQKSAATLLLDGISILLQILIGLVLLAFYHYLLLGFDLILIFCLLSLVFLTGARGLRSSIAVSKAKYGLLAWLEQIGGSPALFRSPGGVYLAQQQTEELSRNYIEASQYNFRVHLRQLGFALVLQTLASTFLLAIGGYLVIQEQLSLGQLVAAEIVVTLVVASLTKLPKQTEAFWDLLTALDKLGYLYDLPEEPARSGELPETQAGVELVLKNVSPLLPGEIRIRPGEKMALAGPPGCGKSLAPEVLAGLRDITQGQLLFDHCDSRDVSRESIRRRALLVQQPQFLAGTIAENLFPGMVPPPAETRRALEMVGLLGEIDRLPDGLRTVLTPSGSPLSSSQKLRLALARAIAARPGLLLLDETLDLLPVTLQPEVLKSLEEIPDLTIIVVTQRAEIFAWCDRTISMSAVESFSEAISFGGHS